MLGRTLNYRQITKLVKEGSKILDLGCGDGYLFKKLVDEKKVTGVGIEIDENAVIKTMERGLSVIQADLDKGLSQFGNKTFDYTILNRTLQSTDKPDYVLEEMLRVGKKAIVSFPNFGYWKVRFYLLFKGKMPKSRALPYEWYNTPNIHLNTVEDFFDYCKKNDINIIDCIYLAKKKARKKVIKPFANFFSEEAIFVISK